MPGTGRVRSEPEPSSLRKSRRLYSASSWSRSSIAFGHVLVKLPEVQGEPDGGQFDRSVQPRGDGDAPAAVFLPAIEFHIVAVLRDQKEFLEGGHGAVE